VLACLCALRIPVLVNKDLHCQREREIYRRQTTGISHQ